MLTVTLHKTDVSLSNSEWWSTD